GEGENGLDRRRVIPAGDRHFLTALDAVFRVQRGGQRFGLPPQLGVSQPFLLVDDGGALRVQFGGDAQQHHQVDSRRQRRFQQTIQAGKGQQPRPVQFLDERKHVTSGVGATSTRSRGLPTANGTARTRVPPPASTTARTTAGGN